MAAYFYLRRLGCSVVARNWKSGHSPGDVDLIAWEGDALCFIDVGTRTGSSATSKAVAGSDGHTGKSLRALAADYVGKASYAGAPPRFDLMIVDFPQDAPGKPGNRNSKPQIEHLRGAL